MCWYVIGMFIIGGLITLMMLVQIIYALYWWTGDVEMPYESWIQHVLKRKNKDLKEYGFDSEDWDIVCLIGILLSAGWLPILIGFSIWRSLLGIRKYRRAKKENQTSPLD